MKLRNGKDKAIMGLAPENEDSSQVLANTVEPVSCLGGLFEDSSSQDGGRSLGERLSGIDVDANHPTLPQKNGSPSRTPKHKKHNPKRFNITNTDTLTDIDKNISNVATRNVIKSNKLNPRELMEHVMFSPVDDLVEENASVRLDNCKVPPTIDSLTGLCGDGKSKNISKCKNLTKRCVIRDSFVPADKIVSTTTKRLYDVVIAPGEKDINDHSENVVYLLTCNNCALQYVGETVRPLGERIAGHRRCIRDFAKGNIHGCKILSEHFNKDTCKGSEFTIRILEKLEGNGRVGPKKTDPQDKNSVRIRLAREKHWMLKLRTVFPFGMNEKVGDEWKQNESTPVSTKFPKLCRSVRVTKGNRANRNKTPESFLDSLKLILNNKVKEAMNFLRVFLFSSSKKTLKSIYTALAEMLNDHADPYSQWYKAAHDIITSKLYKEPENIERKKTDPNNTVKLMFLNKGLEMINLSKLLHTPNLSKEFPTKVTKATYTAPTVVYQLTPTIRSNIFNYKKFVDELNLMEFVKNPNILPCSCADSPHVDKFHKHVVSGDLDIVPNLELKSMFLKGPQYREPQTIDLDAAKKEIRSGIKILIKRWSTKHSVHVQHFDLWKHAIFDILDSRISLLNNSLKIKQCNSTFEKKNIKCCLKDLHAKYVITPIDKATSNVAFICKRFYAQILVNELGIASSNSDQTYNKINQNKEKLIKKHQKDLKRLFKIDVGQDMSVLPSMHWTPKMHKVPSKSRFIVAAKQCTTKELAQNITAILKMFYRQIENYNRKNHFFSYIKNFWVVKNKDPVIEALKKLSNRNNAKSVATYDFSTLYTKIPHAKLKSVLNEITDFCFQGCANSKIFINFGGARWCHNPDSKANCKKKLMDKDIVKKSIAYLLDNCYFTVGKDIFKQEIGIPMGTDPAPFMANLFLYYYENKFMKELITKDKKAARKFGYVWRYIDDLSAVNDDKIFENNIHNIYPPELELKKENTGYLSASFLDIDITIVNDKFSLKLYDKRDDFGFSIVRMPYVSNNMPSTIFYSSFSSELLRVARCTTGRDDCLKSCSLLMNRMYAQGGELSRIRKSLVRLYGKHQQVFEQFFDSLTTFLIKLLFPEAE